MVVNIYNNGSKVGTLVFQGKDMIAWLLTFGRARSGTLWFWVQNSMLQSFPGGIKQEMLTVPQ